MSGLGTDGGQRVGPVDANLALGMLLGLSFAYIGQLTTAQANAGNRNTNASCNTANCNNANSGLRSYKDLNPDLSELYDEDGADNSGGRGTHISLFAGPLNFIADAGRRILGGLVGSKKNGSSNNANIIAGQGTVTSPTQRRNSGDGSRDLTGLDLEIDTLNQVAKDAINAKQQIGENNKELSFLFHSLYGMDSYPGYLNARFSERMGHHQKLRRLANLLQQKANEAKVAADEVELREKLLKTYRSENEEELLKLKFEDMVVQEILDVVNYGVESGNSNRKKKGPNAALMDKTFEEIVESVFLFEFFKPEFCEIFMREVDLFLKWQHAQKAANKPGSKDLNTRLCVVDHLGSFGKHVLDTLKTEFVDVLAREMFPGVCNKKGCGSGKRADGRLQNKDDAEGYTPVDYRYGFCIGYANKLDPNEARNISRTALIPHTDDSEITLTIRLGKTYTGGAVNLRYLKATPQEGELQTIVRQKSGQATLFYGQQLHEVEPVESGERQMLVIWFRANEFRDATCPCCRMYRRHAREREHSCVLGAENN